MSRPTSKNGRLHVHQCASQDDGTWISLCSPGSVLPLQAIATAVDPHLVVHVAGTDKDWTLELQHSENAANVASEVEVVKFSGGASWEFERRKSLPLTVV